MHVSIFVTIRFLEWLCFAHVNTILTYHHLLKKILKFTLELSLKIISNGVLTFDS